MSICGDCEEGQGEPSGAHPSPPRSESPKSLQDHCCPVSVSVVTVVPVPGSFSFFQFIRVSVWRL